MKARKSKKDEPKINKKTIIYRLLSVPKKSDKFFWGKELKILNDILQIFPAITFWQKVEKEIIVFDKVPSLAIHLANNNLTIKEKYFLHFYEIEFKNPEYALGQKEGSDYNRRNNPKTIKQFLS